MKRYIRIASLLFLAFALTACTINLQMPLSSDQQQQAATIVAGTLQALGTPATGGAPTLTITGNSNCRSGPGSSFKVVTSFTAGTNLALVARSSSNNFWQVKLPNSEDTCWVWGQYATPNGDYASLPEAAPEPSSGAAGSPARPSSLFYQYTCPFGQLTTNLSWGDAADNEAGYHVYRWDLLIADLPANSTAYTDVVTVDIYSPLQYSVEAYNSAGASAQRTISFKCE